MRRLLCVTAHPDDEVVAFGGTLLKYAAEGVETAVLCLTAGEAATHRGAAATREELAAVRREELATSCAILRVTSAEALAFPDGALERQPFIDLVEAVAVRIRRWQPQIVLAFGTEGGLTAHPDHAMASHAATAAFHWAADPQRFPAAAPAFQAEKLYYATSPVTTLGRRPARPAPCSARIEVAGWRDAKLAAFHAYQSQAPLFPLVDRVIAKHGDVEHFHLAAATPVSIAMESDLFADRPLTG